jgi:hypothetical protein
MIARAITKIVSRHMIYPTRLAFTSIQSSHGDRILNWNMIEKDYQRRPIKPVIELETTYTDVGLLKGVKPGNDVHARRSACWASSAAHTARHTTITRSGRCMGQSAITFSIPKPTDLRRSMSWRGIFILQERPA